MPVQAMSFLYVRGLARGDNHHAELRELCEEAGASFDDVLTETVSKPDLFASVRDHGAAVADPYRATSAVAAKLRRVPSEQHQRIEPNLLTCLIGIAVARAAHTWFDSAQYRARIATNDACLDITCA